MTTPVVRAAGAVVVRRPSTGPEVLTVHRPRYDDWSLPKGKLHRGETDAVCAAREVAEETGVRVHLKAPLSAHRYRVAAGPKQVDWWLAEAVDGEAGAITDTHEVDEVTWRPATEVSRWLTYPDECERVADALALPPVTPFLIVRHAKALARKRWQALDSERPITDWGRRQARSLVPFLAAFGVRRVVSSSAVRCLQTVNPYARAQELPLEGWRELTEEVAEEDPKAARLATATLAFSSALQRTPTVVCGHRPVLPAMLEGVGIPVQRFSTGETLVVALTSQGTPVAARSIVQRIGR